MSEITDSFREQLHEQLAEAMTLVWRIQNALTETPDEESCDGDIVLASVQLMTAADVISGTVSRWALWQHSDLAGKGGASMQDL